MKVESISIQNFKRFHRLEVSFKNKILDEVSDRFMILGDNGSGKTSLLQAIALPLALATGRIQDIADFDWIGFLPGRYWRWGTPRIELEVSFEEEELEATREIAKRWYAAQPPEFKEMQEFVNKVLGAEDRAIDMTFSGKVNYSIRLILFEQVSD